MRVEAVYFVVVCGGMVLGEVVGEVFVYYFPEYDELSLFNSVLDTIGAHVNVFRATLFDCFFVDASGSGVVV